MYKSRFFARTTQTLLTIQSAPPYLISMLTAFRLKFLLFVKRVGKYERDDKGKRGNRSSSPFSEAGMGMSGLLDF